MYWGFTDDVKYVCVSVACLIVLLNSDACCGFSESRFCRMRLVYVKESDIVFGRFVDSLSIQRHHGWTPAVGRPYV